MHTPVLEDELIESLSPGEGRNFIDCTLGEGGHAKALLKKTKSGCVLGVEWDLDLFEKAKENLSEFGERVVIVNDNYASLDDIVRKNVPSWTFHGAYFDLGACLWHFQEAKRGFSFEERENLLDMRFNKKNHLKALDILNTWNEEEIRNCLEDYGELSESQKIAKIIIRQRQKVKLETVDDLIKLIDRYIYKNVSERRDPLIRKIFQALRIAVNKELANIEEGLEKAVSILPSRGKIAVISYHSLEDRIVKRFFKDNPLIERDFKRPITPTILETRFNPGARSAKLRVATKKNKHVTNDKTSFK